MVRVARLMIVGKLRINLYVSQTVVIGIIAYWTAHIKRSLGDFKTM